ncbi:hypothetical protein FGB62_119g011 [Gracilaria domingensis]|nr:hypothetical protein FGB62_119g011 [Gracilaria domingensis]
MVGRLIFRNYLLALFSVGLLGNFVVMVVFYWEHILDLLESRDYLGLQTFVLAACIWGFACIQAPVLALAKLKGIRISRIGHLPWWFSLFKWHSPTRHWHRLASSSASDVLKIINKAFDLEEGTPIQWSNVQFLTDEDKQYIVSFVEDFIHVKHTNEGKVVFLEKSAWLLVCSALFLNSLFSLSALWALSEVDDDMYQSEQLDALYVLKICKAFGEWVSNFVLLIFALGVYAGSLATLKPWQRESIVALDIAMSRDRIVGLANKGCYSPIHMTGSKWQAPRASSALLASVGKFDMEERDGKWVITWNAGSLARKFSVRDVAYCDVADQAVDGDEAAARGPVAG